QANDNGLITEVSRRINDCLKMQNYNELSEVFEQFEQIMPTLVDAEQNNILHRMCYRADEEAVRLVVYYFPELVNSINTKGRLPLHIACMNRNAHIIAILLNQPHQNIGRTDFRGLSFLHYAMFSQSPIIRNRTFIFLQRVIEKSKQQQEDEGIELLPLGHFPIHEVKVAALNKILQSRDIYEHTFLHFLATQNDLNIFKYFVQLIPKYLWFENFKGMSVMHFA